MIDRQQPYFVDIDEISETPGDFLFTFTPNVPMRPRGLNGEPQRVLKYRVVARRTGEGLAFLWSGTSDDPGDAKSSLEDEARQRVAARTAWIGEVEKLVNQVEQWVQELDWRTRRIDKRLDDTYIGTHRIPALLMQEGIFQVLLEPVGRSAPGVEGIVDLYLLPAYDDIARLYFYDGLWHVHYDFQGGSISGDVRETQEFPLSKETLERVLDELRIHAA